MEVLEDLPLLGDPTAQSVWRCVGPDFELVSISVVFGDLEMPGDSIDLLFEKTPKAS